MSEVQPIEALYYPRAEFPSVAWVKSALLYWEGLLRIVPDGRVPSDPPDIAKLVQAGVIQDLSPAPFRNAAADAFGTRLDDLLRSRAGAPIEDEWSCAGPTQQDGSGEQVHLTELEQGLVRKLESKHLLSAAGEWAQMSPAVARLYQITMANEAAQQLFAAPVTDSTRCSVASTYFSSKKLACDPKAVPPDGLQWAQLYTPFPSQEAAGALSVESLLQLRAKYPELRRAFRESVERRTADIATLPSPQAIRAHLEALAHEMEEQLELTRKALRKAKVHDTWSFIGVSAPIAIGAVTALAGAPALLTAVGTFGTVGLGGVDWFLEKKMRSRTEGHYLLSVGEEVDQANHHGELSQRMRQLTHA
jgi:hypothetical protein